MALTLKQSINVAASEVTLQLFHKRNLGVECGGGNDTTPGGWWDLKNAHPWRGAACMPLPPGPTNLTAADQSCHGAGKGTPSPYRQQQVVIRGECFTLGINTQHERW